MISQDHSAPSIPDDFFQSLPAGIQFIEAALGAVAEFLISTKAIHSARLIINDIAFGSRFSVERSRNKHTAAQVAPLIQPLRYGALTIGAIEVDVAQNSMSVFEVQEILAFLSRPLARFCRRCDVERWSLAQFDLPLALVGGSPALLTFEAALERASLSDLPVLLSGEFGTEKLLCAMSIHRLGERGNGPFIEVNCGEPLGDPAAWFASAEGGTLFLNGVERLARSHQENLPHYMRSHLGQWLKGPGAGDVRVISSTCENLVESAAAGRFSRTLLAEIDMLNLILPPLRLRIPDIEPLLDWILRRNRVNPAQKKTPAMVSLLQRYDWPENLVELERVAIRLVVMTGDAPIERADIQRHAPWIISQEKTAAPFAPARPAIAASVPRDWPALLMNGDYDALASLHPCLRRALAHLARHYDEPLSIAELASLSHASASHLGYLFRTELGIGFKMLQARLRVYNAQRLLTDRNRLPITELALMLGFSDLSHFEKTFRKQVGVCPSAYRRANQGK
jgi:DNA-binding NtrC family response regulator